MTTATVADQPSFGDGERRHLEDEPLADPGGVELAPVELGPLRLGRMGLQRCGSPPVLDGAAAAEREGEREQEEGSAHPANLRS